MIWNTVSGPGPGPYVDWDSIAFGNNTFISIGVGDSYIARSIDGINWVLMVK